MTIQDEIFNIECCNVTFKGTFLGGTKYVVWEECTFSFKDKNILYNIDVKNIGNKKEITIVTDKQVIFSEMFHNLISVITFENLFDGVFYKMTSCLINNEKEISSNLKGKMLSFHSSTIQLNHIAFEVSNTVYANYYKLWRVLINKIGITHNMFLYAFYSTELPADIKISLVLQSFEPLSEVLEKQRLIHIRLYQHKEKTFRNRLNAIINKYGKNIFKSEWSIKNILLTRAVNTRNKVCHVISNKHECFTGKESGLYIYKFGVLYKSILLRLLNVSVQDIEKKEIEYIKFMDNKFSEYLLKDMKDSNQ